jgi:hypothetical protein
MAEKTLKASEVIKLAESFGISRGGLQAEIGVAEATGVDDESVQLNAMRALATILAEAEAL